MVLVSAIVLAFIGFVVYLVFDFKKGLSTTNSVIQQDLNQLLEVVSKTELSSWLEEDIDILSRIGDSNLSKQMFGDVESSILYSIYHEPILAITTKRYLNDDTVSCAIKFNDTSFSIRSKGENRLQVLDSEYSDYAWIDSEELSISTSDLKIIIQHNDGTELLPVTFNGQTKLLINAHESDDVDQTRAIVKKERINNRERDLFILILSFGLIKQLI